MFALRNLLIVVLVIAALLLCGCAGGTARTHALGPAMAAAWPEVGSDAEVGVRAREHPQAAALLGVDHIGPGVAESRRERHRAFSEAVSTFNARP